MNIKDQKSKLNVVVVSYNNEKTINGLLESLKRESAYIAEVVLHDNGSADSTLRLATEWCNAQDVLQVKRIAGANLGFGAGIYAGCKNFKDQSLPTLCLNPDVEIQEGTVVRLLDVLRGPDLVGIVTTPLVDESGQADSASVRMLPRLSTGLAYSVFGKLLPERFRYNSRPAPRLASGHGEATGVPYKNIEATTGALMLVNPQFRSSESPIFDLSYWMYGEDLQLCWDARAEGFKVSIIDYAPSLHRKGTSSGWPRGVKSNIAFHEALAIFYSKNLSRGPVDRVAIQAGMRLRLGLSLAAGWASRSLSSDRAGKLT